MNLRRWIIALTSICLVFICSAVLILMLQTAKKEPEPVNISKLGPYGVFVDADSAEFSKFSQYTIAVLDVARLTKQQVETLHNKGTRVYGYINIGSIEGFRSYYTSYEDILLDTCGADSATYNGNPERWVDVTSPRWQYYFGFTLAKDLSDKGVDGFFIDNTEVYNNYPTDEIYNGIISTIKGLEPYGKDIIVNNGDIFLDTAIERGDISGLIDGVNRECVFTMIDTDRSLITTQMIDTTKYYQSELERYKKAGLSVYLTEYTSDDIVKRQIERYCKENEFSSFISDETKQIDAFPPRVMTKSSSKQ